MKEKVEDQRTVTVKKRLITENPLYRKSPYPYAIPWSSSRNMPLTGQDLTVDEMTGKLAMNSMRKASLGLGQFPFIINPDDIYYVKHSRLFDLSYKTNGDDKEYLNPRDVAEWNCYTINTEFVAPSKKEYNKKSHIFYVQDVEYEAQQDNVELDKQFEAESYIREGSTSRWKDILMLLNYEVKEYNFNVDQLSDNLLKKHVIDASKKYPDIILRLKRPESETLLFVLKVLRKGFIEKKKGTDFYYGSEFIGTTIDSLLEWVNKPINADKVTKWQKMMEP
jgi:hypothetical protein